MNINIKFDKEKTTVKDVEYGDAFRFLHSYIFEPTDVFMMGFNSNNEDKIIDLYEGRILDIPMEDLDTEVEILRECVVM